MNTTALTHKRFFKKKLFGLTLSEFYKYEYLFKNKKGLEVGGKSGFFTKKDVFPIYGIAGHIDGLNFASDTLWENQRNIGQTYVGSGRQYIGEAIEMKDFAESSYDYIISSHCLEHIANPLKALRNWLKVLKIGGALLLVVPDKRDTFDHKRPVTSFDHLLKDSNNDISEDDLTHLNEILELHDLAMDLPAVSLGNFKERCLNNYEIRGMHHHVFDENLLKEIFGYFNVDILFFNNEIRGNLIVLGVKNH